MTPSTSHCPNSPLPFAEMPCFIMNASSKTSVVDYLPVAADQAHSNYGRLISLIIECDARHHRPKVIKMSLILAQHLIFFPNVRSVSRKRVHILCVVGEMYYRHVSFNITSSKSYFAGQIASSINCFTTAWYSLLSLQHHKHGFVGDVCSAHWCQTLSTFESPHPCWYRCPKPRSEGRCQFGNSEGSFRWTSSQHALVLWIYSNMRLGIAMSYSAGAKFWRHISCQRTPSDVQRSSISQASLAIYAGIQRGRSSINAPTVVKAIGLRCKSEVHTSRLSASSLWIPNTTRDNWVTQNRFIRPPIPPTSLQSRRQLCFSILNLSKKVASPFYGILRNDCLDFVLCLVSRAFLGPCSGKEGTLTLCWRDIEAWISRSINVYAFTRSSIGPTMLSSNGTTAGCEISRLTGRGLAGTSLCTTLAELYEFKLR